MNASNAQLHMEFKMVDIGFAREKNLRNPRQVQGKSWNSTKSTYHVPQSRNNKNITYVTKVNSITCKVKEKSCELEGLEKELK